MNQMDPVALDRWITGNYGEDRFGDEEDETLCEDCAEGGEAPLPDSDALVFCAACGLCMNGTQVEDFDTGRRTVESGLAEVIGWAVARGYEPPSEDLWLAEHHADLDHGDQAEGLQWAFEKAEQYLNGLEGYYFEQSAEIGVTVLWALDPSDPAVVPRPKSDSA